MEQNVDNNNQEQEIDLLELLRKAWDGRKTIVKFTVGFMIAGLLIAIFSVKEYDTGCVMVPQSTPKGGGNLSSLASLAGINLNSMSDGTQLSPDVYPNILNNANFRKELMYSKINVEGFEQPVTIYDYFMDEDGRYQKFNLFGTIKNYTIGLPGMIIDLIKGEPDEKEVNFSSENNIISLTFKEMQCSNVLKERITLTLDTKKGYLELNVSMPEALIAAQTAIYVQTLLQKYITEFKVDKVQNNMDFIQERYNEVKKEFEQVQAERAVFTDENRNLTSARAQTERDRLDAQYNLTFGIYRELATQLEQAKISVKENTASLTVIDPVVVPIKASKPNRMLILIGFTFLGFCAGVATVVFVRSMLQDFKNKMSKEAKV
ncbi:MAG: lipopolysaccharide biosynthesis protein [Culturomica sp.]|jgi:uncharacterized protein involved in exopolysaccharide biosynthesis|nr:lipopolysaccharide biosynthesis protein [Culturomica sp.]